MTKIIFLVLGSVIVFSLGGCADLSSGPIEENSATTAPDLPAPSVESHLPQPVNPIMSPGYSR
jgi:hypothetical protein